MGKLVISTNTSLDGVVEDPDGKEGSAFGGWLDKAFGADRDVWAKWFSDEAMRTEALLLGRRSEVWFGSRWASRTGAWADRLNGLPKYVVSRAKPTWTNARTVNGDVVAEVAKLKREIGGEIAIYASYRLVPALLAANLIDELRLVVFPVVVGAGRRLFGEGSHPFRLTGTERIGNGLVLLTYANA